MSNKTIVDMGREQGKAATQTRLLMELAMNLPPAQVLHPGAHEYVTQEYVTTADWGRSEREEAMRVARIEAKIREAQAAHVEALMSGSIIDRTGRRRSLTTAASASAVPDTPTPEPVTIPDVGADADYRVLAAKLGIRNAALDNANFREFLAEEGIMVYPMGKVDEYLRARAAADSRNDGLTGTVTWCWRPLRGRDASAMSGGSGANGRISPIVYAHPVPYPVLLTVDKIQSRFGDQVQFFVSDYEVRRPDPFLMVTGEGLERYVVERWDEPSFRG